MDVKLLDHIYKKDSVGAYTVEISLDKYSDLFNVWDPAPYKKRDLDQELKIYLEECSWDIPLKHKLALAIYLPEKKKDLAKEKNAIEGLRNHYRVLELTSLRQMKKNERHSIGFFLAAVVFWSGAFPLQHFGETNVLWQLLSEGLFLGGWVMGWEVFSALFFKNGGLKHDIKEYRRMQEAKITFYYQ